MGDCNTIQIIEEGTDPNLSEEGEVSLAIGQSEVAVTFLRPKISSGYRFEYLYVDAFGETDPGTIEPVVTAQTQYGFVVELGGVAEVAGYVLRWRVVVKDLTVPSEIDKPESFRVRISLFSPPPEEPDAPPPTNLTLTVTFENPRSSTLYGFTELRVENLDDNPATQAVIHIQVVEKTETDFTIAYNPSPPTNNYYLVGRTP